jgi:hypothetical protein
MKTIPRSYDDARMERINRYNERRLERLKQLEGRGYSLEYPGGIWRLWAVIAQPMVRWGWITAAQVYYPIVKRIQTGRKIF